MDDKCDQCSAVAIQKFQWPTSRGAQSANFCSACGSDRVTTEHHQMFMVNTGDHYCHAMKTQDAGSQATCIDCEWTGERRDLKKKGDTP